MLKLIVSGFAILGIAAIVWVVAIGRDQTWRWIAGPEDLGPVDFSSLQRRTTTNDALICPASFCPNARSDLAAPSFSVSPDELSQAFDAAIASEPNLKRVDDQTDPLYRRYVERSRLMRFPDTIDVRFLNEADTAGTQSDATQIDQPASQIAIYSRSQLGRSDFGVNRKRIERWLGFLSSRIAQSSRQQ